MDIRLDDLYEKALKRLAQKFGEPTATGMNRVLIRDAAIQHDVWDHALYATDPIVNTSTGAVQEPAG